jgi:phosphoribosylglycinamide formyltransferase-1
MRLGVLVSGGGTNLQALLDAGFEVGLVLSDRPAVRALERAEAAGVPTACLRVGDYPDRAAYSAAVAAALAAHGCELVVLAGYLKILRGPIFEVYGGRIINTHPALLPLFGGPGMHGLAVHQAVLDHGCKVSGCTVHFVDESVDGGPIIAQTAVEVADDDTAESLQARILPHEHAALVGVVAALAEGRVTVEGRRVRIAPPTEVTT